MKALITFPHNYFLEKVAGIPLISRMIRVLQKCDIKEIYILSNILELEEDNIIKILRTKEEMEQVLGDDYLLIDTPAVFDDEFIKHWLHKDWKGTGILSLSRVKPEEYQGVMVPLSKKEDVKKSEKRLLASLRKPYDTFVSRNLNRPISLFVSKFLMQTKITPNWITLFVFLVGVLSALVLVYRPDYWGGVIGGTLFHLASVLDGCDGEIARLKFQNSKLGVWLDNASDETTNLLFIGGLGFFNAAYFNKPFFLYLGFITMGVFVLAKTMQYYMIIKGVQADDIAKFEFDFEKTAHQLTGFKKFANILFQIGKNMARNDFMALSMMAAGILDVMHWAIFGTAFFTGILFISVSIEFISKVIFSGSKKKKEQ